MAKLFDIKFENIFEDVLNADLINSIKFNENFYANLNNSIVLKNQDEQSLEDVNIRENQNIDVLDLMPEKTPVDDLIVNVLE